MADNNESKEVIKLDFQTNANQAAKDVNNLNVSIEQTTESVEDNSKAIDNQNESYKSLKTQLREANQELQRAVQIYGETSEQAIKAAQGVAELRDTMQASADLAETFNPDQKFKALGAATQLAATGVQGVTAGMALFGDQSEDTEKLLLKVQSAMAFSDAISSLSDLGDQWNLLKAAVSSNALATKANAAATGAAAIVQNLFTGSVNTSSTGFKGLKVAIAGTGIGLLVVGLVALISNFDKVKAVVLKFVPGLEKVGDTIMGIVQGITDFIGVTSEAGRAIDKQKAYAEKSLAQTEKYLKRHENTLTDSQKRELELRNEHFQRVKDGEFSQAESLKIYREAQAKDAKEASEKAAEEAKQLAEKQKAAREKLRKEEENRIAKEKAAKEKQDAENKRNAEFISQFFNDIKKKEKEERDKSDKEYQDSLDANTEAQKKAFEDQKKQEEQAAEDRKKRAEAELAQKDAIQGATLGLAGKAVDLFKAVNGKSKDQQKEALLASNALGVAEVIINTQKAVSADLAVPFGAGLPKIPIDIASGALGVASIISATVKGLEQIGRGGSTGSPTIPKMPSGANAKPQAGFQASSENQIATSINNANQAPTIVKAFVVASDVTDQQTLDAKLVGENSFGGTTGG